MNSRLRVAAMWLSSLCAIALVVVSAVRIYRSYQPPGPFDPSRQGYCDFHNGLYFPSLAFSRGDSPYGLDYEARYPVERSIPLYSPLILALHVPWTWLSLNAAEAAYFAWTVLLVFAMAYWLWWQWERETLLKRGWWIPVTMSIVVWCFASRGGQQTVFTGYFTFELIFATLIAVRYARRRPWLSALALAVVSSKPNFVVPLGILMLFRGDWRTLLFGAMISIGAALAGFSWILPEDGWVGLVEQIQATQEQHNTDAYELPANSWMRIDLVAIVAKWTSTVPGTASQLAASCVIMLPFGWMIYRQGSGRPDKSAVSNKLDDYSLFSASTALVLTGSLIGMYHHVYDSLMLIPVIMGLLIPLPGEWADQRWGWRISVAGLLAVPGINYASTQKFLNAFQVEGFAHQVTTSVNCIALVLAALLMSVALMRVQAKRSSQGDERGNASEAFETAGNAAAASEAPA